MHLTNLPVAFADVQPFRKFGVENKPALLLGMDGLKLFDRVSIDFDTLGEGGEEKKDTVTVRNRDTGEQERVTIDELASRIR